MKNTMDKKLIYTRDSIFKRCPTIFWEVTVFVILAAILLIGIDTILPGAYFFTFSLIFFPLLFSALVSLFSMKNGGTISLRSTFAIARSYFKPSTISSFNLVKGYLIALAIEFGCYIIFPIILSPIFTSIYGSEFTDLVNEAINLYIAQDYTGITTLLSGDNSITLLLNLTASLAFSCGLIFFVFRVCYRAPVVYLSANLPNARVDVCNKIFTFFRKKHKKEYLKDFFYLNWPMLALFLGGLVIGYVLALTLNVNIAYLTEISSALGILFMLPMAPYFFANTEALFSKYDREFKLASKEMTIDFLIKIKSRGNLSPEDQQKIDEMLARTIQEDPEENKKDSDDGV